MTGELGGILRESDGGGLSTGCGSSPIPIVLRRHGRSDPKEARRLRPLPVLLALGAAGSFVAALVPGFNSARCLRRGVALGAVAFYAWMVV
jgi:hypothetical protein